MITVRKVSPTDTDALWAIFHPIVSAGETYAYAPDMDRSGFVSLWIDASRATYVATDDDHGVLGTYFIRPNQPGLGDHICNAGFMVAPNAQGKGVGRTLGEHALETAKALGFLAMQFNYVVSANKHAVRLWENLGFAIVGTVPRAFRHAKDGLTDVHIMYRDL